ncbi:peptidoglycan-binding protein [Streptomyces sp. Ncost-T10-10d]|uniref:peptidoglycan-binding domain-containing protein n=1 Tax=Streptomyces sp. Ncost-T10-10d TaxID=1839774 RepID=UPI00081ECADA|nr:peptidoglycan-binding domain-containing protein [Streptomyces sp. Ncost-T10-10d]SCF56946.1 Putative peptidoglycan binding domain-containing protein [Streptomyces sp. Ncost-T10-10d]
MNIAKKAAVTLAAATLLAGVGGIATATGASATSIVGPCANYSISKPYLSQGSSGAAVQELQCELNLSIDPDNGYTLDIDGGFGPRTKNAVLKFQACVGIQQDGIVGPATWSWLDWYSKSAYYAC